MSAGTQSPFLRIGVAGKPRELGEIIQSHQHSSRSSATPIASWCGFAVEQPGPDGAFAKLLQKQHRKL